MNELIWIVGSGNMGIEYTRVLKAMGKNFFTIGRGELSAKKYEQETGIPAQIGGIESYLLKKPQLPSCAIVCVGMESLHKTTIALMRYGVKKILVEKPSGVDANEVNDLYFKSIKFDSKVFVAYNRRFYSSVLKAKELIKKDGGVLSFNFDFTEMTKKIEKMKKAKVIKENWLFGNSTHVIDLAFFLCGSPSSIECNTVSRLDWHPSASVFTGSGFTKNNIPFSYHSNWNSAGRWGLNIFTKSMKLIFQPLEKLQVQYKDSFESQFINVDDSIDENFKPGIYLMVNSFLTNEFLKLKTLKEQVDHLQFYSRIGNYNWK